MINFIRYVLAYKKNTERLRLENATEHRGLRNLKYKIESLRLADVHPTVENTLSYVGYVLGWGGKWDGKLDLTRINDREFQIDELERLEAVRKRVFTTCSRKVVTAQELIELQRQFMSVMDFEAVAVIMLELNDRVKASVTVTGSNVAQIKAVFDFMQKAK